MIIYKGFVVSNCTCSKSYPLFVLKSESDLKSLGDLRDCLFNPNSGLQNIDLMYNRIGEPGALVLAPALGADNTKIKTFLVDLTLPMHAFDMIFRRDAGGKKKG
jgi:hypothetical protein